MKRNFFLTSVLVLAGLMRPTLAETFPADGYMLEDKTYENAATYTNTGVYEGTVNATAEYTDNIYKIAAGMYLPKESETAAPCTAGYYCPGKADAMYSESGDQGLTKCPAEYPNSAAGAGAQTQCYTACTLATANIAHATGVSGNDYYGDGTDTCATTECDLGYHVNSESKIVDKTPLIPVDYALYSDIVAIRFTTDEDVPNFVKAGSFEDTGISSGLTEPNTWATLYDSGIVYGHASCNSNPNPGYDYMLDTNESVLTGQMTLEEFENGLAAIAGEAMAAYATNLMREYISAMETADEKTLAMLMDTFMKLLFLLGTEPDADYSTTDTGTHCYCQLTGYTPTGGDFEGVASAPWVYRTVMSSTDYCKALCSYYCAGGIYGGPEFNYGLRAAMYGVSSFEEGIAICAANDITINWTDAEEIGDAGMCKYGGDIKTPVKAVTKKGKTFKGWRFEKTN